VTVAVRVTVGVGVGVSPVGCTVGVGECVGVGQTRTRQSLLQQAPSAPAPGSQGSPGARIPSPHTGQGGSGERCGGTIVVTAGGLNVVPAVLTVVVAV
jgi:hypothetical protein